MQNLVTRIFRAKDARLLRNFAGLINSTFSKSVSHTTVVEDRDFDEVKKVSKWLRYNEKVYPPQDPSEPPRPAVNIEFILLAVDQHP